MMFHHARIDTASRYNYTVINITFYILENYEQGERRMEKAYMDSTVQGSNIYQNYIIVLMKNETSSSSSVFIASCTILNEHS